jgi:beta-N-acetylhexosaminidase
MSHGPLMLDLAGPELLPEEGEMLRHPRCGGVILFSRNYRDPQQLRELVTAIHRLRTPSLLVAVDQEGGRVQRFRDGFVRLPPAGWLGRLHDHDAPRSLRIAHALGWLMAAELRALGVDFSFAPVLDLDWGVSGVIGDRAFHRRPAVVAELAQAWVRGVHEAGMPAVGKHFPGHGGVTADSHTDLPEDPRRLDDLWMDDLFPFQRLIEQGLEAIMPAHVIYSQVAPQPAGFSPYWLREVLRRRLDFQGVIFSDDLTMSAAHLAGGYPERAAAALEAGCDMVLVCNNPAGAAQVLDSLADYNDPVAGSRIVRMHGRRAADRRHLHLDPRWREAIAAVTAYDETPVLALDL